MDQYVFIHLPFVFRSASHASSSYAVCITCLPPFGWLYAIDTLPSLYLHFPYPSSRVPCSIRPCQYVEYLRENPFFLISWIILTSIFWFAYQIHDSDMITGHFLEKFINGPAHHTLHHLYFTVNYGQVSLVLLAFLWFLLHIPVLYVGWSCWGIISSPRFCIGPSDGCEVGEGRMKKKFNNGVSSRASYQLILIPNAVAVYESRSVILYEVFQIFFC